MTLIYKIYDNTNGNCYIGSTKQKINQRLKSHRGKFNGCESRNIIKNNDYEVIILEECDEEDRFIREQYWVDNSEKVINKTNIIHDKENRRKWLNDYKPKKKEYDKKRREWFKSWGEKKWDNYNYNHFMRISMDVFK